MHDTYKIKDIRHMGIKPLSFQSKILSLVCLVAFKCYFEGITFSFLHKGGSIFIAVVFFLISLLVLMAMFMCSVLIV